MVGYSFVKDTSSVSARGQMVGCSFVEDIPSVSAGDEGYRWRCAPLWKIPLLCLQGQDGDRWCGASLWSKPAPQNWPSCPLEQDRGSAHSLPRQASIANRFGAQGAPFWPASFHPTPKPRS